MRYQRLALAVITLPLLAASAAAAPNWTAARKLKTITLTSLPTNDSSVAVAPSGDAVAVWINDATMQVQAARRTAGTWSAARNVYTASTTLNESLSDARAAIQPDGTAVVVFSSNQRGRFHYCNVAGHIVPCYGPQVSYAKAATLLPGATAWTKVNLSALGFNVIETRIGSAGNGDLVATWLWTSATGAQPELQAATAPVGGAFGAAQTVVAPTDLASGTSLAVGSDGDALVVWHEQNATTGVALRSIALTAGTWEAPETFAAPSARPWTLRTALGVGGEAAAVWEDGYAVWLAQRTAGAWTAPTMLVSAPGRVYGMGGYLAYGPDIGSDAVGDLVVGWLESDPATGAYTVEAEWRPIASAIAHRSWPIFDMVLGMTTPHVAAADDGKLATIAWMDNGMYTAYAALYDPATGWKGKQPLGAALWDTQVQVAANNGPQATAVWLRSTANEFMFDYVTSSYKP